MAAPPPARPGRPGQSAEPRLRPDGDAVARLCGGDRDRHPAGNTRVQLFRRRAGRWGRRKLARRPAPRARGWGTPRDPVLPAQRGAPPPVGGGAPMIGIVIPTLNEGRSLGPLLDDLRQLRTSVSLDVVVVDGGSTDGTWATAMVPGVRIRDAPRGRARQLNAGARAVRGEWLLF